MLRARLARLEQLCPGDFAAVKRQIDILATAFSVAEFLDQLEAEHRIKPEVREGRAPPAAPSRPRQPAGWRR
jgi:hypothetical protein